MPTVNLDTAARLDIVCRKGDTFSLEVLFDENMPADGVAADNDNPVASDSLYKMEVKLTSDASTVEEDAFVIQRKGDTDNTDAIKTLVITNTAENMDGINAGLYVYDLQYASAGATGIVSTYLTGTFEVREDVTDNA